MAREPAVKEHDTVLYEDLKGAHVVGQVERVWTDRNRDVYMVEVKPINPASDVRKKLMWHEVKAVL